MSSIIDLPPEYEIESELGRGAMGVVYRAKQVRLGRPVAIKVLHANLAGDSGFRTRFETEAKVLASIDHPNIVGVIDFGVADDSPYIVMHFIEGESLDTYIQDHELSQDQILSILRQLASALGHAHRQGVVHRDVKAANVMITNDGHAMLTDFGVAKSQQSSGDTQAGMSLGTPKYMAPEVCRGEPATALSDLYSLGVLAYELFTGKLPFNSPDPFVMMALHVNEAPADPIVVQPGISMRLRVCLLKCLAKDPGSRYPSGAEFVTDLGNALHGGANVNRGGTRGRDLRGPKQDRRRIRIVLALVLAGFAFLAATIVISRLSTPEMPSGVAIVPFQSNQGSSDQPQNTTDASQLTSSGTNTASPAKPEQPVSQPPAPYHGVGERYLTFGEVQAMSSEDIRNTVNYLCAKHGRDFKKAEVLNRFINEPWYRQVRRPGDYNEPLARFSNLELANYQLLCKVRESR